MNTIFNFSTHYDYLKARLDPRHAPRGIKSQFSESIQILPAFLSQVLKEKYALSLEQADLANHFFDHSEEESEFFILLTSKDRAGSVSLRKRYQTQINNLLEKRKLLIERLGKKKEISNEAQGVYYSSWHFSAVHVACTIENLRNRKAISEHLNIPFEIVGKILNFLEQHSLITKDLDSYKTTENWLRLSKDSPHIIKHHTNWRLRAISDLEIQTDNDLHYSGIFSIDEKTALQTKEEFLTFLKKQTKSFETAKETDLFAIGVDFFKPFKKINSFSE